MVHLEFARNHEGRVLSAAAVVALLREAARRFTTIVVVGNERRLTADMVAGLQAEFVDMQGLLSVRELIALIAGAAFIGIDSFPAHIAEAAGVRAAIFFGAVHPLARVWNENQVWPIVADLDCIGCYHVHLEPSVPFCMRRDQMCTSQAAIADVAATLDLMQRGVAFDWGPLRDRFRALQAKLVRLMRHHPAPPERIMRRQGAGNEQVSTLIYRVTEQLSDLLSTQYRTSAMENLTDQVRRLQAEIYARDIRLDSLQATQSASAALPAPAPPMALQTQIIQLCNIPLEAVRCRVQVLSQWIQVEGLDSDPQLLLPKLVGCGEKIHLRLACDAAANETLQVLWGVDEEGFGEDRMQSINVSPTVNTADLAFTVAEGSILRLRIDPSTEAVRTRLRGSIGGAFRLVEAVPPPPPRAADIQPPPAVPDKIARRRR